MSPPQPIAVWDTRDRDGLYMLNWREAGEWAQQNMPDANSTYRAEFYMIDAPCVKLYRFASNERGSCYLGEDGGPTTEPPVMVMLPSLPPRHLLGLR